MSEGTELTMTIPAPRIETPMAGALPMQKMPALGQFEPKPLTEVETQEKQKNSDDFSFAGSVPFIVPEIKNPNSDEAANESVEPANESETDKQEVKPDRTEDDEEKFEELREKLQELTEESGLELKNNPVDEAMPNTEKDPVDDWLEALDKTELTVDLKAQFKRALFILMKAIWLMIINPNEQITGKDLGLPQEAPDNTSNELEREEQGSRFKSWNYVLRSVDNVQGTIMEVAGVALAANEQAVPMKIKEKDKEKKRKKSLKKMLNQLMGKDKAQNDKQSTAKPLLRRIITKPA